MYLFIIYSHEHRALPSAGTVQIGGTAILLRGPVVGDSDGRLPEYRGDRPGVIQSTLEPGKMPTRNKILRAAWKRLNQDQAQPWKEALRILILKWIYIVTGRPRKARLTVYKRRRAQLCFESCCPCCPELDCWKRADELLGTEARPQPIQQARITEDNVAKECLRSTGGLLFGLTFTSVFGLFVLFIQEYNLWYCLVSTITVAVLLGLGMGLSAKIRVNILLMVPHIFTSELLPDLPSPPDTIHHPPPSNSPGLASESGGWGGEV
ncbi:hypothetical protein chiPu_0022411 [Chiloscyllium punctatum]|uniref:Uncharacterized protein n=1 Tax=Chiloscyllium punctatum TaxID=137246 RepID=A0A401RDW2_CHIPU|nr:hypothetical protein [Chiloscyllium punctatum]